MEGYCNCTSGFGDLHCSTSKHFVSLVAFFKFGYDKGPVFLALCSAQNQNITFSQLNRSLTFVIQRTITMTLDTLDINQAIAGVLQKINNQNANWISQYSVVTFTDTSNEI